MFQAKKSLSFKVVISLQRIYDDCTAQAWQGSLGEHQVTLVKYVKLSFSRGSWIFMGS